MSESDGIDEAIEGISRVGLTVAGRLGEQVARAREQALRRAQATEEQQARELQARFDAERAAARAQLAPMMDNRWWDTASGRDVERVHEAATAWKDHDPAARSTAEVIRDQVQRRYGLDVDNLKQASSTTRPSAGRSWPPALRAWPTARRSRHGSAPTRTRAPRPAQPWPPHQGAARRPARRAGPTAQQSSCRRA